jgi:hypothetical protein
LKDEYDKDEDAVTKAKKALTKCEKTNKISPEAKKSKKKPTKADIAAAKKREADLKKLCPTEFENLKDSNAALKVITV